MASLKTNTELFLANTTNNSGTINLPVASSIPGRVVEFKDSNGTFNSKNLTLVCNGSDTFEDSSSTKVMNTNRGNIQLVASGSKWYILNGTQVNTFQVSSLTTIGISSFLTNTSSINVSSLGFMDNLNSTNTLYTSTSFLFYNNFIISGTRVGYSNLMNMFGTKLFLPTQLSNLSLWLDAMDSTTVVGTSPVTLWKDKSGNGFNATPFNSPTYSTSNMNITNGSYFQGSLNINAGTLVTTSFTVAITPATYVGNPNRLLSANNGSGADYASPTGFEYSGANTNGTFNTYRDFGNNTSASIAGSTRVLVTTIYNPNGTFLLSLNGNYPNGSSIYYTPLNSNSINTNALTNYYVGRYSGGASYWSGYINEIIIFNRTLSQGEYQQVEGYLAWKWGLFSQLPSSHPFHSFQP